MSLSLQHASSARPNAKARQRRTPSICPADNHPKPKRARPRRGVFNNKCAATKSAPPDVLPVQGAPADKMPTDTMQSTPPATPPDVMQSRPPCAKSNTKSNTKSNAKSSATQHSESTQRIPAAKTRRRIRKPPVEPAPTDDNASNNASNNATINASDDGTGGPARTTTIQARRPRHKPVTRAVIRATQTAHVSDVHDDVQGTTQSVQGATQSQTQHSEAQQGQANPPQPCALPNSNTRKRHPPCARKAGKARTARTARSARNRNATATGTQCTVNVRLNTGRTPCREGCGATCGTVKCMCGICTSVVYLSRAFTCAACKRQITPGPSPGSSPRTYPVETAETPGTSPAETPGTSPANTSEDAPANTMGDTPGNAQGNTHSDAPGHTLGTTLDITPELTPVKNQGNTRADANSLARLTYGEGAPHLVVTPCETLLLCDDCFCAAPSSLPRNTPHPMSI